MHYILLTVTVFSLAALGMPVRASDYPGSTPVMEGDASRPPAEHRYTRENEESGDLPKQEEPSAGGGTSTKEAEACIDSSRNFPDAGGGSYGSRAMNKRRNCE